MKRRSFLKSSLIMGGIPPLMAMDKYTGQEIEQSPIIEKPYKDSIDGAKKKPNIIFIMSDQHRGDTLGCMGNKAVFTPSIDALANEGTLFVSGFTTAPSSTPARAGLLTGMSPWKHGMLGYGKVAEKYAFEMPQMLRDLGYYTFGIGKMHYHPQNALHGFHATLLDESGRSESKDYITDYRKWFQLNAPGKNPDLTGIGWNDHGFGIYKLEEKLHPTTWTGQTACELIRNYDNEDPLFLKVSFARPHSPYDPPQRYFDMYKNVDIPKPVVGDCAAAYTERLDPSKGRSDAPFGNFGDDYAVEARRHYYANVTFIDDQVGEIVKMLKAKGMYDNTIICFTADHGDMLGDHHHWRKTYPYQGSVLIPYVVKWPETIKNPQSKIDAPVELRDFLPTFIDIAGGTVPSEMDGKSLVALAVGKNAPWRKYIDLEHATCYSNENYWYALTDGKVKYVWRYYTGEEELYDLIKDPSELSNLVKEKKYQKLLLNMRAETVANLSERGEGYVKDGKLVVRKSTLLYSPNYPKSKPTKK